jgi:pyruvate dehydrogenase E2 component (dihydrolipoamide acetyltransferase)
MLALTLSVDHRVIDGALGAELLGAIKSYLEKPSLMLV